jgi:hypothetical protein
LKKEITKNSQIKISVSPDTFTTTTFGKMRSGDMKLIVFSLFTILSATAYGQVTIINQSLTDSSINIFYMGVDNKISIKGKEYNEVTNTVRISGSGASISKDSTNHYIVRATAVTDKCKIGITSNKGKKIAEKLFRVKPLAYPEAQLGLFRNAEEATVNEILIKPFVNISSPGCYYQYNIQVVSFDITVAIKDSVIDASATGNQLSARQIELIRNADKDLLTVDNIRALFPDGRTRKLPSLVIYLK